MKDIIYLFADSIVSGDSLPQVAADSDKLRGFLLFFFGVIAAISFLMIVWGGFKYVISIGDPQKIVSARKTIVYSIVGLIIALSATTIVSFVIGRV